MVRWLQTLELRTGSDQERDGDCRPQPALFASDMRWNGGGSDNHRLSLGLHRLACRYFSPVEIAQLTWNFQFRLHDATFRIGSCSVPGRGFVLRSLLQIVEFGMGTCRIGVSH